MDLIKIYCIHFHSTRLGYQSPMFALLINSLISAITLYSYCLPKIITFTLKHSFMMLSWFKPARPRWTLQWMMPLISWSSGVLLNGSWTPWRGPGSFRLARGVWIRLWFVDVVFAGVLHESKVWTTWLTRRDMAIFLYDISKFPNAFSGPEFQTSFWLRKLRARPLATGKSQLFQFDLLTGQHGQECSGEGQTRGRRHRALWSPKFNAPWAPRFVSSVFHKSCWMGCWLFGAGWREYTLMLIDYVWLFEYYLTMQLSSNLMISIYLNRANAFRCT